MLLMFVLGFKLQWRATHKRLSLMFLYRSMFNCQSAYSLASPWKCWNWVFTMAFSRFLAPLLFPNSRLYTSVLLNLRIPTGATFCPNLESLSLEICDWDVVKVLNISALALKTLVISSSPWFEYGQNSIGFKLEISAPKLESFIYRDLFALDYDFGSFSLLHTAKLEFRYCRLMDRDLASRFRRMLQAIIHANLVYLSGWTVEVRSISSLFVLVIIHQV